MLVRPSLVALAVATVALAGCASADFSATMEARAVANESELQLTVEDVEGDLVYDDVLIMINDVPWRLGPEPDHVARMYSVDDKDREQDEVEIGDVIRVPATGQLSVELRHRDDGATMQELDAFISDSTAPGVPSPTEPGQGEGSVSKQAVFRWAAVTDPSGVEYQIEWWLANPVAAVDTKRVAGLESTSYAISANDELLPQTAYRWHVRAVDGFGNQGPWSQVFEFETGA